MFDCGLAPSSAYAAGKEVGQCDKVANRRLIRSSAMLDYVNRYQLWHNVDDGSHCGFTE